MRFSFVHNLIRRILDILFPPKKRIRQIRKIEADNLERLPPSRQPEKVFISAVCDYRAPAVRQVVKAAKYDGSREAVTLMSECMQEELLALCQENRIFADKIVITPVPISDHRRREHGFNHSWRIAQEIEARDESNTFQARRLLRKVRKTPAQTSLSKKKRLKNLAGSFTAKEIDDELVIVIDDVTTTGATLTEARRAIKEVSDAKVLALTFAH
ncbi:MAG: hypothetical protein WD552_02755 [Candidatus Paceibacterota bacterium]